MPLIATPPARRDSVIAAELFRVVDHPDHRAPDFIHDLVHARGRRQRVLDQRQIEPDDAETLAEERVRLLVVHLPVAAVDVGERWRAGRPAGEDVESVTGTVTVAKIEPSARR